MSLAPNRFSIAEAERYLASLELFGMRFGLDRMRRLMTTMGSPQMRFDSIHVVGTNGKSSTTRMIAAILAEHDLRTGAYLSPHITSPAERIEVDGAAVSDERFAIAVGRASQAARIVERTLVGDDRVTQFEALTAAAYWELGRSGVEVAAVEAGLGARYDATSVVTSAVQVLTNVGLEHTRWLGPTEADIAAEKLAVVPERGRLVTGTLGVRALAVAERVASDTGAGLVLGGRDFGIESHGSAFSVTTAKASYERLRLHVLGDFQRDNFALAVAAAEAFCGPLDSEAVRAAAARLTLPGRLEVVSREPLTLFDGAHNASGMRALAASLARATEGRRAVAVVSILDDKDAAAMLAALLPRCAAIVFTRSEHARALSPATLDSLARQIGGPPVEVEADPRSAVRRAEEIAGPAGAVLVTGSIYLLSDLAREDDVSASRASII